MSNLPKRVFHWWPHVVLVGVCMHLSACGHAVPVPSEQERKAYRQAVAPIVSWLESEYATRGSYPSALPLGLNEQLQELYPPTKYNPYHTNAYEICIGDYNYYRWAYVYDSRNRRWVLDQ